MEVAAKQKRQLVKAWQAQGLQAGINAPLTLTFFNSPVFSMGRQMHGAKRESSLRSAVLSVDQGSAKWWFRRLRGLHKIAIWFTKAGRNRILFPIRYSGRNIRLMEAGVAA